MPHNFMQNVVRNQKYSMFTFLFLVLYEQFKMFFNLFFLLIALSQLIPILKVGYWVAYFGPLGLVLLFSMIKEGMDDWRRYKKDK
jgi:phospholipid-translocating ATPase